MIKENLISPRIQYIPQPFGPVINKCMPGSIRNVKLATTMSQLGVTTVKLKI